MPVIMLPPQQWTLLHSSLQLSGWKNRTCSFPIMVPLKEPPPCRCCLWQSFRFYTRFLSFASKLCTHKSSPPAKKSSPISQWAFCGSIFKILCSLHCPFCFGPPVVGPWLDKEKISIINYIFFYLRLKVWKKYFFKLFGKKSEKKELFFSYLIEKNKKNALDYLDGIKLN